VHLSKISDSAIRRDCRADVVARVVGAIFIPAGVVKFAAYAWELENFRRFGLPAAPAWVAAAGIVEVAGGVLLVRGRAVVVSAALLAITMVVAIAVSGVAHGDVIPSLTIAPALLAALLYLLTRPAARARASSG